MRVWAFNQNAMLGIQHNHMVSEFQCTYNKFWLMLNKHHKVYLTHFLVRNLLTNFFFLFVWLRLGSSCCDKVDKNKSCWNNQVTNLFGPESTDTVRRTVKSMEKWGGGIGGYWVHEQIRRVYLEYGQITRRYQAQLGPLKLLSSDLLNRTTEGIYPIRKLPIHFIFPDVHFYGSVLYKSSIIYGTIIPNVAIFWQITNLQFQ